MKNSWGQEVNVGSLVYRGARLGNGTEYKVGVISSLNNDKVRVDWKFKASHRIIRAGSDRALVPFIEDMKGSTGSPSFDSLVVVDFDMQELARQASFHSSINYDTLFSSVEEFQQALDAHTI